MFNKSICLIRLMIWLVAAIWCISSPPMFQKKWCSYWVDKDITHLQREVDKVEWKLIQKLLILFHALGCDKSDTKFATNLYQMHKSFEYFILIQNDHIFVQFTLFKCILKLQTKTMIYIVVNNLCFHDKSQHKKYKCVNNNYTFGVS